MSKKFTEEQLVQLREVINQELQLLRAAKVFPPADEIRYKLTEEILREKNKPAYRGTPYRPYEGPTC